MRATNIVLLAAGYNKNTDKACSLWSFVNGKSILDWQLDAFQKAFPRNAVNIAVGYDFQRIIENHPKQSFSHVVDWEKGTSFHSFLSVLKDFSSPTISMYGDTVFQPDKLVEFSNIKSDVTIAVDSVWRERFSGRSREDIALAESFKIPPFGEVEYTGLIKFSSKAMQWIFDHHHNYDHKTKFIDFINDIVKSNLKTVAYDVAGEWAEMNEPNDLIHFVLGSKAETLRRIQPKVKKSKICDQITSLWKDWSGSPDSVIADVQLKFMGQRLIVRSSTLEEDGWETANAGVFESVLDIDSCDANAVREAIQKVFLSYGHLVPNSQVLIQPLVTDVAISGVLFTCDLVTGAPYYIINYDDVSGRTDSITSGQKSSLRTAIISHYDTNRIIEIDRKLQPVVEAAQELEQILGYGKLDIEFAVDKLGQCYTFQIRPIVVKHDTYQINNEKFGKVLFDAQNQFEKWQKKPDHILGDYTLFSGMTDWNPAEIIGSRPSALAVSLYNHLITEEVWAKQRAEFGYRDIRPAPLVHNFCGQPYVDCRASINSFIPAELSSDCAVRLANIYLDILKENPHLHDKLELEVVFTIWTPAFRQEANKRFRNKKISKKDINSLEKALKKLTSGALTRLKNDIVTIEKLSERFQLLSKSELDPLSKVYLLIEDCREFGTLAFSHAARAGFVAITLMKSLVKIGDLSHERLLEFQASVPTVATEFQDALSACEIDLDSLIKQFGHLRPGTYDINQMAYWEKPDLYFRRNNNYFSNKEKNNSNFTFTKKEIQAFQSFLNELSISITVDELVKYIRTAIQAREGTKFEFTRNLSAALDVLIKYAEEELGIPRNDVGYLTYDDIRAIRTGQIDEKLLVEFVKLRKNNILEKQIAKLPSLISNKNDFFGFEQESSQANFITTKNVVAELIFVSSNSGKAIGENIIAIPSADPGFDWIFSHNIKGLVTQHGGANSHMAIRCAELGIPAAIGIGDKLYEALREGLIILDCEKERLEYV